MSSLSSRSSLRSPSIRIGYCALWDGAGVAGVDTPVAVGTFTRAFAGSTPKHTQPVAAPSAAADRTVTNIVDRSIWLFFPLPDGRAKQKSPAKACTALPRSSAVSLVTSPPVISPGKGRGRNNLAEMRAHPALPNLARTPRTRSIHRRSALGGRSTVAKSSTTLEMSYTGFVGALSMSRCSLGSQGFPWVFGGAQRVSFTGSGGCRF